MSEEMLVLNGYPPFFSQPPAMTVEELQAWEAAIVDPHSTLAHQRRVTMSALVESEDVMLAVMKGDTRKALEYWIDIAEAYHLATVEAYGYAFRAYHRLKALYDELYLASFHKRTYKPRPTLDARGMPIPEPVPQCAPRTRKTRT